MQKLMDSVDSIQSLREAFVLKFTDLKMPFAVFMPCGAPVGHEVL